MQHFFIKCIYIIKQQTASQSVLVSAIFEKNDEQGGKDCLSTAGFQNFGFPEPSRGFPNCFRADRLSCRFCGTRFAQTVLEAAHIRPLKQ